jgi:HSP20 family molecular chaperone IbpA
MSESIQPNNLKNSLIGIGFIALAALGYYNWDLHSKVAALENQISTPAHSVPVQISGQPLSQASPATGRTTNNLGQTTTNSMPAPFQTLLAMRQNPDEMIRQMQQQMQNMDMAMNQFMSGNQGQIQQASSTSFGQPDIKVTDEKNAYEVVIDVPKDSNVQVNTSLDGGHQFTVNGTVKNELKNDNEYVNSVSQFSRSMYLSDAVKQDGIKTQNKGNQIVITLPKV